MMDDDEFQTMIIALFLLAMIFCWSAVIVFWGILA
jgi:hypothetical protein